MKLIFALMYHYVPHWLTSIDPNNCSIFKTHLQDYISVGRFLGMLLIIPGFLHVDPPRRIAKCTFGSDQFKCLHKSVLFFERTVTLMESEWWGKNHCGFSERSRFQYGKQHCTPHHLRGLSRRGNHIDTLLVIWPQALLLNNPLGCYETKVRTWSWQMSLGLIIDKFRTRWTMMGVFSNWYVRNFGVWVHGAVRVHACARVYEHTRYTVHLHPLVGIFLEGE